jgi:hypothetical protein
MIVIAASWFKGNSILSRGYIFFLILTIAIRESVLTFFGWAHFEKPIILPSALLLMGLAIGLAKLKLKTWMKMGMLFLIVLLALQAVQRARNGVRYKAIAESTVLHDFVRYWIPAAQEMDRKEDSYRIAFTSGAAQNQRNWFWYYFLGNRLQNRPYYVPIEKSGRVAAFGPDYYQKSFGDFDSWHFRLRNQGIDYVMSFYPNSIEQNWMELRPEQFERIEGNSNVWGLYRILK